MKKRLPALLGLLAIGMIWGVTFPLNKISVSQGYQQFGLIFWNQTIGFAIFLMIAIKRQKWPVFTIGTVRLYLAVAVVGSILPLWFSFLASRHLPAGLVSLLISLVPMFTFAIALSLKSEGFVLRRFLGLVFGLVAVGLIMVPGASLPDKALTIFVPVALVAPFFYALEGNLIELWEQPDIDPIQIMTAATGLGMVLSLPLAMFTGQWISLLPPFGAPDQALIISSLLNVIAYTGYIWLIGRAGAVFAAQVAYLVTIFGVFWSMIILSETYSGYVWLALLMLFIGLFLVTPRPEEQTA